MGIGLMGLLMLIYFPDLKNAIVFLGSSNAWRGFLVIIVGSLAAFIYNLSVYYFTRAASALAVMVASNFIKVCIIVLSAIQTSLNSAVQVRPRHTPAFTTRRAVPARAVPARAMPRQPFRIPLAPHPLARPGAVSPPPRRYPCRGAARRPI